MLMIKVDNMMMTKQKQRCKENDKDEGKDNSNM